MNSVGILLGTTNFAKQQRFRWLLSGLSLDPLTPAELGLDGRGPQEEGSSHEEIARVKAQRWSEVRGGLAIASDGGLVIPALGGRWKSVLTHRFAGEDANDDARLKSLLHLMRLYKGKERAASWTEALAIAQDGRVLVSWRAEGPTGLLLEKPGLTGGIPGFWVFSTWYLPDPGKTYAELDEQELEHINDHWSQLRSLVQRFFRERTEDGRRPES